jgi:Phosphatidylinositol 3- and 4-kinase
VIVLLFVSAMRVTLFAHPCHDVFGALDALRRFDSPKHEPKIMTPSASRAVIEALVTNVVARQLAMPSLTTPDEGEEEEDESKETEPLEVVETQQQGTHSPGLPKPSKMSTLGSSGSGQKEDQSNPLSKTGDTRREVLNAIMMKGMSGSHVIAEQAATGAQRHLQDLERRVAVEALLTSDDLPHGCSPSPDKDERRKKPLSLGIRSASREDLDSNMPGSEEDEAMEAIRLLLIQYGVATGSISANDAAMVLAPHPRHSAKKHGKGTIMHFGREFPEIDAGDIDPRLVGCGVLPPAVLQALTLWKGEMISNGELLELVKKDLEFEKNVKEMEENTDKLNEDSAFWGRFAFGERWAEKRSRLAAKSPDASHPGWDLIGIIVKSNDDLRQESFIMQLIELCQEAFQEAELELWLLPYRIVSTSRTSGIIEMVRNAMSFDALKKRPGYGSGGLREHLQRMTRYAADPGEAFKSAQSNFVRSLAAYSLLSYLFLFKDRHNGNILLDTAGHVIHIDFGFVFGIAPGGSFSLEMSTPFKLTDEMIEVMDGLRSSHFSEFVTLFCCGFLALQAHCGTFMTLVEVTSRGSTFQCFEGRDTAEILGKMQERFRPDLGKEETVAHVLDIIKESIGSYGTKQYDYFQYLSQGIAT